MASRRAGDFQRSGLAPRADARSSNRLPLFEGHGGRSSRTVGLSFAIVTQHQLRIARFVLGTAFAGLGIWALAKAEYGMGAIFLVLSAVWLLMAIFSDRLAAMRDRRRAS